jgi:hypothetical protein
MSDMQTTPNGNNIAPTAESANPIVASGQTLDQTSNTAITVTSGVYVVTAVSGYVTLGLSTQATAANILWVATVGGPSIHVCVPENITALNYICVGASSKAYLRKVYE